MSMPSFGMLPRTPDNPTPFLMACKKHAAVLYARKGDKVLHGILQVMLSNSTRLANSSYGYGYGSGSVSVGPGEGASSLTVVPGNITEWHPWQIFFQVGCFVAWFVCAPAAGLHDAGTNDAAAWLSGRPLHLPHLGLTSR